MERDIQFETFRRLYPNSPPPTIWRAPGRVNLIGEHTDYNEGFVLPMAIEQSCYVLAAPSKDGVLRASSLQFEDQLEIRTEDIASAHPNHVWWDRVIGIAQQVLSRGVPVKGAFLMIDSEVPSGAGLSSSAALSVALALAMGTHPSGIELAHIARAAESDFIGVPCGIMDPFISANARAGAALLIDCRTLDTRVVPLPSGASWIAVNSEVRHSLAGSEYSTRVQECRDAAAKIGVKALRDGSLRDTKQLGGTLLKRARHVISENRRVIEFETAAAVGDLQQMGELMIASHSSLSDDYEVSCAELDFLVNTALSIPGVYGSRMTGGGFGGCTISLVSKSAVKNFHAVIEARYYEYSGRVPQIYACVPTAGALQLLPS